MIRTSPATYYRAAGAVLAAAVLTLTARPASAQQTVDLFGGTLAAPTALSVTGLVNLPTANSGPFGPGFSGTTSLSAGALNTLSEGFSTFGSSNAFTIAQGGVLTLAGSTSASKTFTGISLTPGGTYQLTLTRATGYAVGLLGNVNFALASGTTTVLNTATGVGLIGVVDVLGLFGSNNTATLQFTVPNNATGDLGLTIASTETAGLLGGSYTFQSATVTQVPEPRTVVTLLLGATGLVVLRFRRRLRAA